MYILIYLAIQKAKPVSGAAGMDKITIGCFGLSQLLRSIPPQVIQAWMYGMFMIKQLQAGLPGVKLR